MWRDTRIQATIDNITGYVVSLFSQHLKIPIHVMQKIFLSSETFALLSDVESGLYHSDIKQTVDMFTEEIKPQILSSKRLEAKSYFKYRPVHDSSTAKIFTNKTLWYAKPSTFNDPFDCAFRLNVDRSTDQEIKTHIEKVYQQKKQECPSTDAAWAKILTDARSGKGELAALFERKRVSIYEESSVFCFSHIPDSILMFSHYADGHKGICLEFSFSEEEIPCGFSLADMFFSNGEIIIEDVEYRPDFPELDYIKLSGKTSSDEENYVKSLMLTKSKEWAYEKEVRIFREDVPAGAVPFKPEILKRVIFGLKAGAKEIRQVKEWLKDWPTPVVLAKAEPDEHAFKLNITNTETIGG